MDRDPPARQPRWAGGSRPIIFPQKGPAFDAGPWFWQSEFSFSLCGIRLWQPNTDSPALRCRQALRSGSRNAGWECVRSVESRVVKLIAADVTVRAGRIVKNAHCSLVD